MTYSASHTVQSELEDLDNLSPGTRAYFRQRQRNRLHNFVLSKFRTAEGEHGLTQARLARRMGRSPDVVNRWLRSPGNWRLDTLSDFLLAIGGEEIETTSINPAKRSAKNYHPLQDDLAKNLERNWPSKPANLDSHSSVEKLNKEYEPA